jgi:hypothetical protein
MQTTAPDLSASYLMLSAKSHYRSINLVSTYTSEKFDALYHNNVTNLIHFHFHYHKHFIVS